MNTRTIRTKVMFLHPFILPGLAETQPAGTYGLTTDQEELVGLSFITFRTVAVFLQVPGLGMSNLEARQVEINLDDLDACVCADRTGSSPLARLEMARLA